MTHRFAATAGLLLVVASAVTHASGSSTALPVKNGRPIVAMVNDSAISLDEMIFQIGSSTGRARLRQGRATAEEVALVERLITSRLIAQEATTMGIDQLPEIRKQVDVTSREILREVLLDRLVKDVRPNPAAVEAQFRDLVREWKTASLLFQDEAAARRARQEIDKGATFTDVAARAANSKTAKPDTDTAYHASRDYLPQIAAAIAPLRAGQVSPVIRIPSGFVLVKVVDLRYPENADARAEARKRVVSQQQVKLLKAHDQALRRQYVVVNSALVKSLDYQAAKPGLDALLKDKRVVARIAGGPSLTVGDLTDYLRMQFFHGTDQTKQRQEMNAKKDVALDATIGRRLLNLEAQRLGIDKTYAYRDRVNGYRESIIFDTFVQKVIVPGNKMREEEVKGYYGGHLKDYSYPEMMKVRSLAFTRRPAAEAAMRKLREGTDYAWLATNADEQVDKGTQGLMTFDGRPLTTESMPAGVQKALAGSKSGDLRLYASPEGHYYVLAVQQVTASSPKPYDDVRQEIAQKLYNDKLKKSIGDYAAKLRAHSKVETYLKKVQ